MKWLFAELGYEVHPGKYSAETGVDLVASKNGEKIVIQARRYPESNKVSNSVILKAQEAMGDYGCKKSIVVATSYFTSASCFGCSKVGR